MKLFDFLFTTKIPQNMRYSNFTWPHLLLLLAAAGLIFLAALHIRKLDADKRQKMLLSFTWALPVMYLIQFVTFWLLEAVEPQISFWDRLPFQLCTMNAIIMPVAVTKKSKILLNYMYGIAMPGAAAAMLTPAMSYYGKYFYLSWQVLFFFLNHGLMVAVTVLAVTGGLFRPDYKFLPKTAGLLLGYAAVIYPVNKLFGQNYLFLNYPDEGTVMAFFAKYLGNPGYLFPLFLLAMLLILLMYLPWIIHDRIKKAA